MTVKTVNVSRLKLEHLFLKVITLHIISSLLILISSFSGEAPLPDWSGEQDLERKFRKFQEIVFFKLYLSDSCHELLGKLGLYK